jgi:hypothetical protein
MNLPIDQIKTELSTLALNLLDALESGDQTKTLVAQQAFSGTITTLWNTTEEIDIDPKLKAVSRLVVGWAIDELPQQIQDPANNSEIKRQLKLFQRSLIMLN